MTMSSNNLELEFGEPQRVHHSRFEKMLSAPSGPRLDEL